MSTSTSTDSSAEGAETAVAGGVAEVIRRRRHARAEEVLRRVVATVVAADLWDESVYRLRPEDDWMLIHRESWEAIREIVDQVDAWRPWSVGPRPTAASHHAGDRERGAGQSR